MTDETWNAEQKRAVQALRLKLEKNEDCLDLVDAYGEMMRSISEFTNRLLGPAGTRAVMSRSIKLASRKQPLVAKVQASHIGPELGDLRNHVAESGCSTLEVINALEARMKTPLPGLIPKGWYLTTEIMRVTRMI